MIVEMGNTLAPEEVCGILLPPDYVVRLPNRAKAGLRTESYEVYESDVLEAVERWAESETSAQAFLESPDCFDFVVWHTHPAGGVGPSLRDMRAKRELYSNPNTNVRFLVVALPSGDAAFF